MKKVIEGNFDFIFNDTEYFVTWEGCWTMDRYYGADFDGNRSSPTWIMEYLDHEVRDKWGHYPKSNEVLKEADMRMDKLIDNLELYED